ncbi:MAG TPA: hypothetical protein IAC41_05890 [Candidatus Merdenecus merdavium]|nr:hypothetical protein [Candidatus Merdenecus merdavium]
MADITKIKSRAKTGIVLAILIVVGIIIWYFFGTQAGSRSRKTLQSSVTGMERTVTVYDINGEIIKEYKGKFDVQYDESRILFDDEEGKRHVIYYTTGTVIIDEN